MDNLEQLYKDYYPALLGYALRRVPTLEDAEDVVQHTFLKVATARYAEQGQGRAFLFKICKDRIIDQARRRRAAEKAHKWIDVDFSRDPQEYVPEQLYCRELVKAARLTPLQFLSVWTRHARGFSIEDTARALGRTPLAVRSLCHRALHNLSWGASR